MQSANPKVSIIILSYNQDAYIKKAIDSVIHQTYTNLEIIISDNGSTDSSKKIIKSYLDDKRVIFLDWEQNKSISLRHNQAVQKSSGDFVSILYGDDYYMPSKIEHQLKIFSSLTNEWAVVHGPGFELDNTTGAMQQIASTKAHGDCLAYLFERYADGFINPIAPLVRRKVFLEFQLYEDMFSEGESIYWRIATKYKFFYSEFPLVVMRFHEKNMGKAIKKNMDMHLVCLERLFNDKNFPANASQSYSKYKSNIIISNAWHCLRTNFEIIWAKKLILSSIKSYPRSLCNSRYAAGVFFILMPRWLIFITNRILDFVLRKKFIAPLKDYYN